MNACLQLNDFFLQIKIKQNSVGGADEVVHCFNFILHFLRAQMKQNTGKLLHECDQILCFDVINGGFCSTCFARVLME